MFRTPTSVRLPDGRHVAVASTGDAAAPGLVLTVDGVVAAVVHWHPASAAVVARVYAAPAPGATDAPVASVTWPPTGPAGEAARP